ncbi:MAG: aminodeoxychorismate/anthranilate synthase component II [Bacteriovoracaceae bacterium]
MIKALFIDFDDSFTYNVVQELSEIGIQVELIHWKDFESLGKAELLVLGPGPGHPDDYQQIFPMIQNWMSLNLPVMGICLGHQILWRMRGENVVRSKSPSHGQKVHLNLNEKWKKKFNLNSDVEVQRYNSLCVPLQAALRNPDLEVWAVDDEIMISKGKNVLTYQFHPESVGTSYRRPFFQIILSDLV